MPCRRKPHQPHGLRQSVKSIASTATARCRQADQGQTGRYARLAAARHRHRADVRIATAVSRCWRPCALSGKRRQRLSGAGLSPRPGPSCPISRPRCKRSDRLVAWVERTIVLPRWENRIPNGFIRSHHVVPSFLWLNCFKQAAPWSVPIRSQFRRLFFSATVLSACSRCKGGVPEWSIGAVSKTVVPSRVPWVRIPPPPPEINGLVDEHRPNEVRTCENC